MHGVLAKSARASLGEETEGSLGKGCQRVSSIFNEERGTAAKAAETEDK